MLLACICTHMFHSCCGVLCVQGEQQQRGSPSARGRQIFEGVRWEGCSPEHDAWAPESCLQTCPEGVQHQRDERAAAGGPSSGRGVLPAAPGSPPPPREHRAWGRLPAFPAQQTGAGRRLPLVLVRRARPACHGRQGCCGISCPLTLQLCSALVVDGSVCARCAADITFQISVSAAHSAFVSSAYWSAHGTQQCACKGPS